MASELSLTKLHKPLRPLAAGKKAVGFHYFSANLITSIHLIPKGKKIMLPQKA